MRPGSETVETVSFGNPSFPLLEIVNGEVVQGLRKGTDPAVVRHLVDAVTRFCKEIEAADTKKASRRDLAHCQAMLDALADINRYLPSFTDYDEAVEQMRHMRSEIETLHTRVKGVFMN